MEDFFYFSIQDSLQADSENKLKWVAGYRKTSYSVQVNLEITDCKTINRNHKYQKRSVIARYLKATICS